MGPPARRVPAGNIAGLPPGGHPLWIYYIVPTEPRFFSPGPKQSSGPLLPKTFDHSFDSNVFIVVDIDGKWTKTSFQQLHYIFNQPNLRVRNDLWIDELKVELFSKKKKKEHIFL
jgi:hypothetical protein